MAKTNAHQPVITVTSAQTLTKEQVAQVKKILSERAGKAEVVFAIDTTILGGIQIAIGDQKFDASLDGQLRRLQLSQDRCVITTAIPLTADQRQKLSTAIAQKHGSISIDEVVDPAVVGGIKIVIGSKEYDRTIAGRLSQLHKQARITQ